MSSLLLLLLLVAVLAWAWASLWRKFGGKCCLKTPGRVLLITAHPDDECMFFAPTILALTRAAQEKVYLLCLSEGNYYGRGAIRRRELYESASILGIDQDHVKIIDDRRIPDGPDITWPQDVVAKHISEVVEQHGIQTILTFDSGGVSGHRNHTAVYAAVRRMHTEPKYSGVTMLLLESTNLLRKYTGVLDLAVGIRASHYAVASLADYLTARRAMQAHWSQYVWFRRLYICISRYMVTNTFRKLNTQ